MIFRGKKVEVYLENDIQILINNKVPESKDLDYKRDIKFDERSKTELIYDICSFYNTECGCLIIGLDEEKDEEGKNTGIPKLPDTKISVLNFDQTILRIEETVKQTTNPQITGLTFSRFLKIDDSDIFIIGIPKTKTLPSMVTYNNINRFYKRKSNGKYTLDTYELYEAFLQIGLKEEQINDFVKQRQKNILDNRFWKSIGNLHSVVIHMIPLSFFNSTIDNFSGDHLKNIFINQLKVPGHHSYSYRYCLEGFHLFSNGPSDVPHQIIPYNLIFRNGCIESFTNEAMYEMEAGKPNLYSDELLRILKEQLENNFKLYKTIGIDFPFYLSIKFNHTRNLGLIDNSGTRLIGRFEYNHLELPISLLTGEMTEVKKQIKNMLDILWQSFGANECSQFEFDKVFGDLNL